MPKGQGLGIWRGVLVGEPKVRTPAHPQHAGCARRSNGQLPLLLRSPETRPERNEQGKMKDPQPHERDAKTPNSIQEFANQIQKASKE